ncbi:3-oxoacyl-[acyl-carrier protein] reductase [Richelia intracellularis]|nr:3-oxoacyl-[acyl-carrier protein] reductase [Richelia intracellularis]
MAQVAAEIEAMGVEAVTLAIDLTQSTEVNIAVAQLWRSYVPIHLLVHCAGVASQKSIGCDSFGSTEYDIKIINDKSTTVVLTAKNVLDGIGL